MGCSRRQGRRETALTGRGECRWGVDASIILVQLGGVGDCPVENRVLRSCARDRSLPAADAALIRGSEPGGDFFQASILQGDRETMEAFQETPA
jgi:hypothetical protein